MSRTRNTIIVTILLFLLVAAFQFPPSWRRTLRNHTPLLVPYRAPLLSCQSERKTILQGSYFVYLDHGYSLEKHKQTVGKRLDSKIWHSRIWQVNPETVYYGLYYRADDIDDATLDAIRADTIVNSIGCDHDPLAFSEGETVDWVSDN